MSDGKLQVNAQLVADVTQADIMQRKLAELKASAEQTAATSANVGRQIDRSASQQEKTFRAKYAVSAIRQFLAGDAEGGFYALSKVGRKLEGLLLKASLFSAVFIGAFKVGATWAEKQIEKVNALAKHYELLADQINASTRAKVKSDATFAAQRIDQAKDKARTQTETRLGDIERRERESAAKNELAKAQGAAPSSQGTFDIEKATAKAEIQRDLLAAYETELAAAKKRAADMERGAAKALARNDGTGGDLKLNAALQQKQVRELAKTVEQERTKLAELNAELETARRIATVQDQTLAARQNEEASKAAELASKAKRSFEQAKLSPAELLQSMIGEAEALRQSMDAMPAGAKRSEMEADYYQMMERILDLQANQKAGPAAIGAAAVTPVADAYSRIGLYLGGAGGSGVDFNRRTATATEKSAALLNTIAARLQTTEQPAAVWG